jgi:uncharacterized protein (DUF1501 family)
VNDAVTALRLAIPAWSRAEPYGGDAFGSGFSQAAHLIATSPETRVVYFAADGFDTHVGQLDAHADVLKRFGDGLATFIDRMERMGRARDVTVLAFSEFGRRLEENGTGGTEHGAAGPVFVAGASVRGGVHGEYPSLRDLDNGDLRHTTDMRSVYASVLRSWLGWDDSIASGFRELPIF